MTKNEVEEACYQIMEYIRSLQPQIPIGYHTEVAFLDRTYPLGSYRIRVFNHAEKKRQSSGEAAMFVNVEVTFVDGETHESVLTHGNLDSVSLDYKVELLKKWPIVKDALLSDFAKETARLERAAKKKAEEEERLCASVTSFTL